MEGFKQHSDLQGALRLLIMAPLNRPHMISYYSGRSGSKKTPRTSTSIAVEMPFTIMILFTTHKRRGIAEWINDIQIHQNVACARITNRECVLLYLTTQYSRSPPPSITGWLCQTSEQRMHSTATSAGESYWKRLWTMAFISRKLTINCYVYTWMESVHSP